MRGDDKIKREKFIKFAESRTNNLLKSIRSLSHLSNRNSYAYTPEDVKEIFNVIKDEIKKAESRFNDKGSVKDSNSFKLSNR